ncbi:hypothetical protein ACQ4PT_040048 [Festuca glaucescens]
MDGAQARNGPSVDGGAGPSTSYSTADADDNGGAGGAKVWVLVLLFSLLVLLFLPSAVRRGGTSGGGGFQRGGITLKSGWDVVNLCLVLFAILCGLLGRGGGDGDGDGESASAAAAAAVKSHREVSPAMVEPEPIAEASTEDVWERLNSSYDSNQSAHTTAGIRRMKSSSSYPELRLGSDGVWGLASPELAWRPYDDAELYRPRRDEWPDRTRGDADRPRLRRTSSDVNAIPVDKYEVRAPPQDARRRRRSVEKPQKMAKVVEEEGRMHPAAETLAARPARSRTWSPEELNATLSEADKYEVPTPLGARRPRRSAEKLPKMPAVQEEHPSAETLAARPSRSRTWSPEELNATLSEIAAAPPPATPRPRHRRHSVESLPTMEEVEKEIIVEEINNPLPSSTALFPPGTPPPPPPPPPPPATMSRSKKKRSGSVGGAKELASAIALFYQKKRKSIIMKRERHHHHHHHLSDDHYSSPSSESSASPEATTRTNPPPRPPPPPPPPSPSADIIHLLQPLQKRRQQEPPHPLPRAAETASPASTNAPIQETTTAPVSPRSYAATASSEGEEEAPSVTASPAPSYCASPDVNTKADNFIERFRAGLKLEKINSYREKLQIQEGATVTMSEEDGEFMVIGSLFEDDDDMSLPGTPATAAAAAVAVGY